MKFFLDTANIEEIKKANSLGIIDGITTNPTLISKEGKSFTEIIKEITSVVDGPISAEVIGTSYDDMLKEARELSKIHKNIVVKIPMTNEGLMAVKSLSNEGIKTNVTLVFSPVQALFAAKAGATYVSPFVGRIDDISYYGMNIISDIVKIYQNYEFTTQVLVASVRNPLHVLEAALLGADVATIPFKVFDSLIKHPLTDIGIKKFLSDWEKVPESSNVK